VRSIFIIAVTDENRLLVTHEHRIPVNAWVVGCPAGLVGDEVGQESEDLPHVTRRELIEEAGYAAKDIEILTAGAARPGMNDEVITLTFATGLTRVGKGGGVGDEKIKMEEVSLAEIVAWLWARVAENTLVDPKVYTGLYFLAMRGLMPVRVQAD
jgi:ADP-ribose pyrophosphatase